MAVPVLVPVLLALAIGAGAVAAFRPSRPPPPPPTTTTTTPAPARPTAKPSAAGKTSSGGKPSAAKQVYREAQKAVKFVIKTAASAVVEGGIKSLKSLNPFA